MTEVTEIRSEIAKIKKIVVELYDRPKIKEEKRRESGKKIRKP